MAKNLRLSPEGEVVCLVLGKSRIGEEDLQERPDVSSGLLGRSNLEGSVREAYSDRLIDIKNIRLVVP